MSNRIAVMPLFFARLGVKWMLAVGMLAWVTRYALFALGAPDEIRWMVIGGIVSLSVRRLLARPLPVEPASLPVEASPAASRSATAPAWPR